VNAACKSANHGQPRISKLVGEFLRGFCPVMCCAPRADNADGMMIASQEFAPDIEHNRGGMDLAERPGIRCRLLRNNSGAEITDAFEVGGENKPWIPNFRFVR